MAAFLALLFKNRPALPPVVPSYQQTSAAVKQSVEHVSFKDVSWAYGLIAAHRQTSKQLSSSAEALGGGICIGDINQDQWMDIFVVGGSGTTREYGKDAWWHKQQGDRLFLNIKGRFFEDVTERFGISQPFAGMGCVIADLDNNGLPDILLSGLQGHLVYANVGRDRFVAKQLVSNERGAWATQAALADINDDGLLDIYSTRFIQYAKGEKTFEQSQGFLSLNKVDFSPALYDAQENLLFRNVGDMRFEVWSGALDTQNVQGRSLGAVWYDINQDRLEDLLIVNGFGTANRIFINNGLEQFVEDRSWLRRAQIKGARNVLIDNLVAGVSDEIFISAGSGQRNTLLESQSNAWVDSAESRGISKKAALYRDDWGSVSADMNNDGFPDIYIASGKMAPDEDSHFVSKAQKNRLYISNDGSGFDPVSGDDPSVASGSSRGVASVDINNDGQLEVLVANNNGWVQLLANQTQQNNSWIGFEVTDLTRWHGAVMTVKSGGKEWRKRVSFKQGLFAQSDPRIHFGLGQQNRRVSVSLLKAGNTPITANDLEVNQYYRIGDSITAFPARVQDPFSPLEARIPRMQEAEKLSWLRLLLSAEQAKQLELLGLWHELSVDGKLTVMSWIVHRQDLKALALIYEGLRDKEPSVQMTALELVKSKEMEQSVYWLLPLFNSQDVQVVCKVAQMFAFFYTEEEAILHRKPLAAAAMVRVLPFAQPQQQVCLLEALAASENKRAVEGIIQVLRQSPDHFVRAAAVRALGQVRDVKGSQAIVTALQVESAPEVIAESLIALSRLRYSNLKEVFFDLFLTEQNRQAQLSRLLALVSRKEDIVLPVSWLNQAVGYQAETLGRPVEPSLIPSWSALIGTYGDRRFIDQVSPLIHEQQSDIKVHGYANLLKLVGKKQKDEVEKQLLASPPKVQTSVLRQLKGTHRFGQGFLASLLDQLLVPGNFSSRREQVLMLLSRDDQASVLSLMLNRPFTQTSGQLIQFAVEHCLPTVDLSFSHVKEFPVEQKLALLNWFYICRKVQEEGLQALQWRVLLNDVLNSASVERRKKLALVAQASVNSSFVANQWLPTFIDQLPRYQVLSIIAQLSPNERNETLKAYLDKAARDESSDRLERLYAYSLTKEAKVSLALRMMEN